MLRPRDGNIMGVVMFTAQTVEAFAVVASVVVQAIVVREMKKASNQMRRAASISLKGLEMAT